MATETMSSSAAVTPKMSRYRSVRRAQEQHTQHVGEFDHQQSSPPPPTSPPEPTMPPMPRMPAVPETPAPSDAPLSRSMSRYHRRPPTSHATSAVPPPIRSMTIPDAPPSPPDQLVPPVPRSRAASSPYQPPHTANSGQPRPRTARPCPEPSPPVSSSEPPSGDDHARDILQKEKERQRQLKDKYDAEARAKKRAKQAELDRIEKLRQDEEDAAREKEQREIEEAETLRRQKEELKVEQERGNRLQKVEPQKLVRQREEGVRKAKQEERSFKSHTSSPPASPPRQQEIGFGMFKRRKDPALGIDAPARPLGPPQLALSLSSQEEETIRPGGGGVVKGIDAPTSAVNAGDRVRSWPFSSHYKTNKDNSVSPLCATRNAYCCLLLQPLRLSISSNPQPLFYLNLLTFARLSSLSCLPKSASPALFATTSTCGMS